MNATQELVNNFHIYKNMIKRLSKFSGTTVKSKTPKYSFLNYGKFQTKNYRFYFYALDDQEDGVFILKRTDGKPIFKDQKGERKFFVQSTSIEHENWIKELINAELELDLLLKEADEYELKLINVATKINNYAN